MRLITPLVTILSCLILSNQPLRAQSQQSAPRQALPNSGKASDASPNTLKQSLNQSANADDDAEEDEEEEEEEDDEDDDNETSNVQSTNTQKPADTSKDSTKTSVDNNVKSEDKKIPLQQPSKPTINDKNTKTPETVAPTPKKQNFEAFTGRITKNKVRMRLQPSFEGLTIRELNKDQLVVVLGDSDDFYAVQPSSDLKAYIFRTYVLDNVIEGTRVNVRLKADLDAPVVTQLNSGDRVEGHIYSQNTKWLEITIPASARFYIAKEYIEKAGDATYLSRMEKRKDEVYRLLNTTKTVSEVEMQKPFHQINLEGIVANYKKIILDYKDFPEAGAKAQEYLTGLQIDYTNRKIAHLEQQSQQSNQLEKKNQELATELKEQKSKLSKLEQEMQREKNLAVTPNSDTSKKSPSDVPYNMAAWIPIENALFTTWSNATNNDSPTAFYQKQMDEAITLRGIIDPYNRPVKNKPGDFMLLNEANKLPIAFLYSTQVNLQNFVGHEVTIKVVPRNNSNYAYPAYFVLSIE